MQQEQEALKVYVDAVRALLVEDEINQAYDALVDLENKSQAGITNDVILIIGNYRSAKKKFDGQLIPYEQFSIQEARAKNALLGLLDSVPRKVALNAKIKGLGSYQFSVPDEAKLEKLIGPGNNLLRIKWLEEAIKASKAVCRISFTDVDGSPSVGTGFLTQEGYLFTNNHVLKTADVVKTAKAEFNYEVGVDGKTKAITAYQLDPSTYITSPPTEYDFARVKVIDRADAPIAQWGFVEFDPEAIPAVGDPVTIIQHPEGEDKQIALTANEVLGQLKQHIFYKTDTKGGSSGSPVFNKNWKVVAIHHAGKTEGGGLVINERGDKAPANRGVLFRDIFAFIKK